jgi:hypothetical protein
MILSLQKRQNSNTLGTSDRHTCALPVEASLVGKDFEVGFEVDIESRVMSANMHLKHYPVSRLCGR